MGRALMGCCVAKPATLAETEEVSAKPPAPPAAPGVVGQAGGGRPAGAVRAALAACGARLARRAKALLWQQRLLQLRTVAPAAVPAAADLSSTAEAGKEEEAGEAEGAKAEEAGKAEEAKAELDKLEEAKTEAGEAEEAKAEDGKEDAGEASPPPRAPSADSLGGASADNEATSKEVRDAACFHDVHAAVAGCGDHDPGERAVNGHLMLSWQANAAQQPMQASSDLSTAGPRRRR